MADQWLSWRGLLCVAGAALLAGSFSCKADDGQARGLSTEECSDACAKLAAADCGDVGSGCVDQCVHGPMPSASASGADCARPESAYFDCFWSAESYVCDEVSGTLPVGCNDQRSALKTCESGVVPTGNDGGAGGAAGAPGTEGGAGGADTAAGGV